MMDIAPFTPKVDKRDKVLGAIRVWIGRIGDAKADMLVFFVMRKMSFPGVEKVMAYATAAVLFEQSGISEIKIGIDVEMALCEWALDRRLFNIEGAPQGNPDKSGVVEDQNTDCFFAHADLF